MNEFLKCLGYLAAISLLLFLLGRLFPKIWFQDDRFPFCSYSFEKDGKIYDVFGVRKWKDRFPDMSTLLPFLMPPKKLPKTPTAEQLVLMIQETCIAELIHSLLGMLGFGCVFLWERTGGWILSWLYALSNLPYIIIQRYNRPKYRRLLQRIKQKEERKGPMVKIGV